MDQQLKRTQFYSSPVHFVLDNGNDLTTDTDSFMIGQRVFVGGVKPGRITFIGEVHFAPGDWAGIVLDEPEGQRFYFNARTELGKFEFI